MIRCVINSFKLSSSSSSLSLSLSNKSLLLILSSTLIVTIGEIDLSLGHRTSGLYVDNGLDQTVIHRVVTQRERREVEHEILNLLGLPDRPRSLVGHRPQVKRSAPKFLIDIYRNTVAEGKINDDQLTTTSYRPSYINRNNNDNNYANNSYHLSHQHQRHHHGHDDSNNNNDDNYDDDDDDDDDELLKYDRFKGMMINNGNVNAVSDPERDNPAARFDLTGQDLRAIDQSDVIMSFAAHNHHVAGVRHERGKRLWFDVSEVPPGEFIIGAELRLYQSLDSKNKKKRGSSYVVTAYRVLRTDDGERELQYVDSMNTSTAREGWLTLNVSEPLQHWVNDPDANRGLYLSVHPADRSVHEMRPEDVGLVGSRGDADKQPFMVGFFKSSGVREAKVREKRDAKRRKKSDFSSIDYRSNPYTDPSIQSNARTCKIQTLYVSFRDLQWQDWIIAPDGYDAYYCSGECNFPLNAHMNATNHAIVQTLVHLVNPGKVPKPCCAPTKLSPISVLYFLDDSNVILKKYKNMVVKSCGCH